MTSDSGAWALPEANRGARQDAAAAAGLPAAGAAVAGPADGPGVLLYRPLRDSGSDSPRWRSSRRWPSWDSRWRRGGQRSRRCGRCHA